MLDDLRLDEIDCIFCWRTSTGQVREGARDTSFNGKPVRYRPEGRAEDEGLRTVVDGHTCADDDPPTGFRLSDQGGISRMGCHTAGFVTAPSLVPARNLQELDQLRAAASAAVQAGVATEWALASIHAGARRILAVHVAARPAAITDFAALVVAPWTLEIRERIVASRAAGVRITCLDRRERRTVIFDGESRFGRATLPRDVNR